MLVALALAFLVGWTGLLALENREANCVSCHQPGATAQSLWDARISISLNDAGILGGALLNDLGHSGNRVVAAGDLDRSMLLQRIATRGEG